MLHAPAYIALCITYEVRYADASDNFLLLTGLHSEHFKALFFFNQELIPEGKIQGIILEGKNTGKKF